MYFIRGRVQMPEPGKALFRPDGTGEALDVPPSFVIADEQLLQPEAPWGATAPASHVPTGPAFLACSRATSRPNDGKVEVEVPTLDLARDWVHLTVAVETLCRNPQTQLRELQTIHKPRLSTSPTAPLKGA